MIIISIDPGVTSGLCVIDTAFRTVASQQIKGSEKLATVLMDLINGYADQGVVVVIEDFIGSGMRDTNIITSIKILGFVQILCTHLKIPLFTQVPQYRNPFLDVAGDDDHIGRYKLYKHRHCKDAYAHALAYIVLNKKAGEYFGISREDQIAKGYKGKEEEYIDSLLSGGYCLCSD